MQGKVKGSVNYETPPWSEKKLHVFEKQCGHPLGPGQMPHITLDALNCNVSWSKWVKLDYWVKPWTLFEFRSASLIQMVLIDVNSVGWTQFSQTYRGLNLLSLVWLVKFGIWLDQEPVTWSLHLPYKPLESILPDEKLFIEIVFAKICHALMFNNQSTNQSTAQSCSFTCTFFVFWRTFDNNGGKHAGKFIVLGNNVFSPESLFLK